MTHYRNKMMLIIMVMHSGCVKVFDRCNNCIGFYTVSKGQNCPLIYYVLGHDYNSFDDLMINTMHSWGIPT